MTTHRAGLAERELGARLLAAAGFVRRGCVAADIGCDHGKLAVYLAQSGVCPRVIAVDSRPAPLAVARALAQRRGCAGRVSCRLGEGLAPLAPKEADDIVVAGLGGETVMDILAGAAWLKTRAVRLVLVPTTRHAALRRWLCREGFAIDAERPVLEKGRSYAALLASYSGRPFEPDEVFCEVGLVPEQGGRAAEAYLRAVLARLHKRGRAPMDNAARARHMKLVGEVEQCLR